VITARVRTVLKSGAKSIFVASSPLTVETQLPSPRAPFSIHLGLPGPGEISFIVVTAQPNENLVDTTFPASGYQVRYSNDGGLTWDFLRFGLDVGGNSPEVTASENTTLIPYSEVIMIQPAEGAVKLTSTASFEMRAVDSSGRPPSAWIGFNPISVFQVYRQ
jgi:hypothetical protein